MTPAESIAALTRVRLLAEMWAAGDSPGREMRVQHAVESIRDALEPIDTAVPYMQPEVDLMRWKLAALREWSDAMINESHYPQYGRDVRTILKVASMDQAREIDAL